MHVNKNQQITRLYPNQKLLLNKRYIRCFQIVRNWGCAFEEGALCHHLVDIHRPETFKGDYFIVRGVTGSILDHIELHSKHNRGYICVA